MDLILYPCPNQLNFHKVFRQKKDRLPSHVHVMTSRLIWILGIKIETGVLNQDKTYCTKFHLHHDLTPLTVDWLHSKNCRSAEVHPGISLHCFFGGLKIFLMVLVYTVRGYTCFACIIEPYNFYTANNHFYIKRYWYK